MTPFSSGGVCSNSSSVGVTNSISFPFMPVLYNNGGYCNCDTLSFAPFPQTPVAFTGRVTDSCFSFQSPMLSGNATDGSGGVVYAAYYITGTVNVPGTSKH